MDQPSTDDASEWQEGSLPAAVTVPFFTEEDFINAVSLSQMNKIAIPAKSNGRQTHTNRQFGRRTHGQPNTFNSTGNLFSERALYRPEIAGISSRRRGRGIMGRQANNDGLQVDNAAYASHIRKEKHGGEYIFSQPWRQLLLDLHVFDSLSKMPLTSVSHGDKTRLWARDELNRLSRQTGTFIATPAEESNMALIWGDNAQIAYARAALEEFEKSILEEHAEKRKDARKWEKITALDARKEHREGTNAKFDQIVTQNGKLEASAEYEYEFWLLWPSQDLNFEQISSLKLQGLKNNFSCAIDYDSSTSFVRIMASEERNLLQVVQRIINLVKEMVAELNQVTKANLLELPSQSVYGSFVRIENNHANLAIPTLQGMTLPMVEREYWESLDHSRRRSNRKGVGKALERCLKSLRLSQKHVRMRVNFGQFTFRQYQLPLDGSKRYTFDDFCMMIENDRTKLELHGLVCSADTDAIVQRCASHPMFVNPTETHSVYIDFKEPDKPITLRLEKEFSVSPDYRDIFVIGRRWLEFSSGSDGSSLEVNMLDFENLDWQMTINSASISEKAKMSQQHDWFETNVTFTPTLDDIKRKLKPRVVFRSGGPKPTLVTELTTVTYDLRDTGAKFQLTRKDEYQQTQYGTEAGPPVSRLSASYFYPNWDNLLGAYAYLQPGGQVDWQPSLSTFFPDASGEGRANGLKKFMEEIRDIQRVITGKPAEPTEIQNSSVD